MSDFDREAEREKLRERFGEEEEDREHSERLSELLLKGATMTDKHCNNCGDPIFRHEGREFCPSCQREVADGDASRATAGQAAARDPTTGAAAADSQPPTGPDDQEAVEVDVDAPDPEGTDADAAPAANADSPPAGSRPAQGSTPTPPQQEAERETVAPDPVETGGSTGSTGAGPTGQGQPTSAAPPADAGAADGLMPARQHLTRTVNRLAQQAAAEEDPGRKREFLAATREAAEALEAVRSAE